MNRLLLVDDTPDTIAMLKVALEVNNYEVFTSFSCDEAIELLGAIVKSSGKYIRMIILDAAMPNKDGLTCAQEIRDFEVLNRLSPATIVLYTGHDRTSLLEPILSSLGITKVFDKTRFEDLFEFLDAERKKDENIFS